MIRLRSACAVALCAALLGGSMAVSQDAKKAPPTAVELFELGEKLGSLQRTADTIDPALERLDAKRKEAWAATKKALSDERASLKARIQQPDFDLKGAHASLARLDRELTAWEGFAQLAAKDRPAASPGGALFRGVPGLDGAVILHGDIVQLRALDLLEQMAKDPEGLKKTLQGLVPGAKPGDTRPLGKQLQDALMRDVERIKKQSEQPKK